MVQPAAGLGLGGGPILQFRSSSSWSTPSAAGHAAGLPARVRGLPRPELGPVYDRHRLFVAPTRFAAGIPLKITGAAAHGLPVVATSLLARQLRWRDGVELLDGGERDPVRFAEQVARLYRDPDLWRAIRENALRRVREEYSREAMKRCLVMALDSAASSTLRPHHIRHQAPPARP